MKIINNKELVRIYLEENLSIPKVSELFKIGKKRVKAILKEEGIPIQSRDRYWGKKCSFWKGYEEISGRWWHDVEISAKKRNIEFNITIKDAWELFIKQNKKCSLTGLDIRLYDTSKPVNGQERPTASLDRICSDKPYTPDNIQWVHKDVNLMKNHFDQLYFIDICKRVAANT